MQVWQDHVALGTNQFLKYGLLAPQAGRVLVLLKAVLVAQVVDPQALAFPARCIDLPKAPRWSGASPCRLLHSCRTTATRLLSSPVMEEYLGQGVPGVHGGSIRLWRVQLHLKLAHKCDIRVVHDDAARAAVPQRAVIAALKSMKADCLQQRANPAGCLPCNACAGGPIRLAFALHCCM